MRQRLLLILCFFVGVSFWIIIISQIPKHRATNKTKSETSTDVAFKEPKEAILTENELPPIQIPKGLNKAQLLILEITRLKIRLDLMHYNFSFAGVRKIEDLLMEYGGTPVRSLIVSTWRSGSSFLGEMVNVMSGNFYHYEPLLRYGIKQIRGPPHANQSIRYLKDMFRCDSNAMASYIKFWKNHLSSIMFRKFNPVENNRRLWNLCNIKDDFCFNSYLVASICKLFPFQSMKVVRFRLKLVKDILEDEKLNVKVVLLVRDPRAVMEARSRFEPFCSKPDCMKPGILCADMISDYVAAQQLSKQYPSRFMVIRYEELMLNINVVGLQVIRFLRLGPSSTFGEYLKLNGDMGLKVTKPSIFKWRTDMDFDSVAKIQEKCHEAMHLWDYELARNASHMKRKNFYPLQRHNVFPLPLEDNDFDGTFNMK